MWYHCMNYEILDQILQMFDSSENSSENCNKNDTAESRQHFLQYLDKLDIKGRLVHESF